jgi:CDGSH-type Zn-finger protein
MKDSKVKAEAAAKSIYIKVTEDGPYLVYGQPPINEQVIVFNDDGNSWDYQEGKRYNYSEEPCALCRCGGSTNKPFCSGAHIDRKWDSTETAAFDSYFDGAEQIEGPVLILSDNENFCAFARFCDAHGRIWNIVERAETPAEIELAKREAGNCPGGRLVIFDKEKGETYEPHFEPSIGLIEDPGIKVSGPIWVRGGIGVESADGKSYETRNRVALCRCGRSANKPFCNGAHASK